MEQPEDSAEDDITAYRQPSFQTASVMNMYFSCSFSQSVVLEDLCLVQINNFTVLPGYFKDIYSYNKCLEKQVSLFNTDEGR